MGFVFDKLHSVVVFIITADKVNCVSFLLGTCIASGPGPIFEQNFTNEMVVQLE